jgi:hypothetical protein
MILMFLFFDLTRAVFPQLFTERNDETKGGIVMQKDGTKLYPNGL